MIAAPTLELNVNLLPPRAKFATIVRVLDELAPGQSLRLVVDHDPAPLRRQFAAARRNDLEWVDEEAGPDLWQVVVGRR